MKLHPKFPVLRKNVTVQSGLGYYLHLEPKGLKETMQEKNSDIFDTK